MIYDNCVDNHFSSSFCSSIMIYDYEVIDWGEYELLVKSFSVTVNLVGAQSFFSLFFSFFFFFFKSVFLMWCKTKSDIKKMFERWV